MIPKGVRKPAVAALWALLVSGGAQATFPASGGGLANLGQPLAEGQLDRLRGGFVTLDRLNIAIGLEQRVAVNGQLVVLNRLVIPDLSQLGRAPARPGAPVSGARVEQVTVPAAGVIPVAGRPDTAGAPGDRPAPAGAPDNPPASGPASRPVTAPATAPVQVVTGGTSPASARALSDVLGRAVSVGVVSGMDAGRWTTVIQNRLDGTVIQNLQQLNIRLDNLGAAYRLPVGVRDTLPILP
ncbi:hypothetical protein [Marinobacter sp. C2H3]|uniref:hypothetical protein n=1 Tax=Marinobacter sp. C2H3 TaxID=3119003 RepID=UPI00300F1111